MSLAFGRRTACQGNQVRLGGAVQFALVVAHGGFGPQGRFQAFLHKALAHAGHRGGMHLQRLTDGFVAPGRSLRAVIGFQQNTGMQQGTGSGFPAANHLQELVPFVRSESDNVLFHSKSGKENRRAEATVFPNYRLFFYSANYP